MCQHHSERLQAQGLAAVDHSWKSLVISEPKQVTTLKFGFYAEKIKDRIRRYAMKKNLRNI